MGPRPFGVTLVGVLILLFGLFAIVGGIFGLFSGDTAGAGIVAMIVWIIIGLIYLAVAKGIFNGNAGSRMIVAIVTVINIIVGIFVCFSNFGQGLVDIIWGLIIMALLYSGKAKLFFA